MKELKDLGLTQSMIAREMHVTRQMVNLWFSGARTPSARTVSRLATAMSTLTGKTVVPAEVYNLIAAIVERKKEGQNEKNV